MGELGKALQSRFEQANNDVIAAVQQSTDAKWQAKTAAEGWSVAVTAHHIAGGHEGICGVLQAIANGQPLPPLTPEMLNQGNALHAQQFANCSKEETLALLRQNGAAAAQVLGSLNDDQLQRSDRLFGQVMTAQQVAEMILIGHAQGHLQSINSAG